jgi:hypothetical protein
MKQRFFAWLVRQFWPHIESVICAEVARIAEEMQRRLDQEIAAKQAEAARQFHQQPQRKFIGQK